MENLFYKIYFENWIDNEEIKFRLHQHYGKKKTRLFKFFFLIVISTEDRGP